MTHSTLYETRTVPMTPDGDGGSVPDASQWYAGTLPDGTLVYHGQPGTPIPAEATRVMRDGSTAWTWGAIAREASADWCAHVSPHRWDSEPTDSDVTPADWPLLQPPSDEGILP